MPHKKITGILACDPLGAIALKGHLPWDIPEEWDHFCHTTDGHIIIMGYKTYLSTPKNILENRTSIVISTREDTPINTKKVHFIHSIDDFLKIYPSLPQDKKIFMIGGAKLAKQFFEENLLDDFLLTKVHQLYEGDTFLALAYLDNWPATCVRREKEFSVYHHVNPAPSGNLETLSKNSSQELRNLEEGWQINSAGHLAKQYPFKDFMGPMTFATQIALIAEKENHHPEVSICWGKCTVETWSHDVGGLSDRDFNLASKIENLWKEEHAK